MLEKSRNPFPKSCEGEGGDYRESLIKERKSRSQKNMQVEKTTNVHKEIGDGGKIR